MLPLKQGGLGRAELLKNKRMRSCWSFYIIV